MIFKLINFILFVCILGYFFRKNVPGFMRSRSQLIGDEIEKANETKDSAQKAKSKISLQIEQIGSEKNVIIKRAKEDALSEKELLINRAKEDSKKMTSELELVIKHETSKAIKEIRNQIVNKTVDNLEKTLPNKISKDEQVKITESAANSI